jgi:hypothetical protein
VKRGLGRLTCLVNEHHVQMSRRKEREESGESRSSYYSHEDDQNWMTASSPVLLVSIPKWNKRTLRVGSGSSTGLQQRLVVMVEGQKAKALP